MKIKKLLTIFVMVLIISLPISFATSLTVTRSSGDDDIDNYFDGYIADSWHIEVEAELGGLPTGVRPDRDIALVLGTDSPSTIPFDSCQPSSIIPNSAATKGVANFSRYSLIF